MTFGWTLDSIERATLLGLFPPAYARSVADHVTCKPDPERAPLATVGEIVGRADDGTGVEALVVRLGGTTDRPDGSTWHITWSLAEGREAKESNTVIAANGWEPVAARPVTLIGAEWGIGDMHPA